MNEPTSPQWPAKGLIAFRLLFSYLILFFFPFPHGLVNPYWLGEIFNPLWASLVPWVSHNLIHIEIPHENNGGSGDSTFEYLRMLCMIAIAILATVVWSVLDRHRRNYRTLHAWLRVWMRYVLALCMLTYGSVKVIMVQFEAPGYGRLIQPLGQFSPMALLWIFMGYSNLYTTFTGITEVVGGLLLFFRPTTTLGALVVAAIMTNVVMLNVSYDVPVKLGSIHLLLLALVLLGPDLRRLLAFFVLNRPTEPADLEPQLRTKTVRSLSVAVKIIFIASTLWYLSAHTYASHQKHEAMIEKPRVPPNGWYNVLSVNKDGNRMAPLPPDEARWRTVSLRGNFVNFRSVDGGVNRYRADGDILRSSVLLYPVDDQGKPIGGTPPVGPLRFNVGRNRDAVLAGILNGHEIEAVLQRENPSDMPLMSRPFRWVIESPYFH